MLLLDVALHPPKVDAGALWALVNAEETLRAGSKSFDLAKLAFGREMRIGLVAVYAWSRVTVSAFHCCLSAAKQKDNLIDESHNLPPTSATTTSKDPSPDPPSSIQDAIVESIYDHLRASYAYPTRSASKSDPFVALRWIPDFTEEMAGAFHLFATLIPRLVPIDPFEQLIQGYETDLKFPTPLSPEEATAGVSPLAARLAEDPQFKLEEHLPIRTTADLMQYADDVAGSTASEICFLAWSILTHSAESPLVPRKSYESWLTSGSSGSSSSSASDKEDTFSHPETADDRLEIVESAREMGRALQLVNIARDIIKDSLLGRLYVPLSTFGSAKEIVQVLIPGNEDVDYAKYNIPLLDMADAMRAKADPAIKRLPRTARGGTRAMLASYFVIGDTIRTRGGRIDERGIKVNKVKRVWAAAKALWLGL